MSRSPEPRLLAALVAAFAAGCERAPAYPPTAAQGVAPTAMVTASVQEPPVQHRDPLRSLAPLVESVKAAVVNVDTRASVPEAALPDDLFERFFGQPFPGRPRGERSVVGVGSGFIVAPDGKVLTNHHVVARATEIRVRLEDGREFGARVLGTDPLTDLALLQLQGEVKELPVVRLGDSDSIRVGDWVVAIGNPFGLASSVSAGIVSAKERDIRAGPYDDFLQTDAAINPGNSGGPLFNLDGEVVGINTVMIGGGAGIGFAVPSNMAASLLPQLEKGEVRRGWLGVSIQDLTPALAKALRAPSAQGAVAVEVGPDSPARKGGLAQDDVIVSLDGAPVDSARALSRAIAALAPGAKVRLGVFRAGDRRELVVELGQRPELEVVPGAPRRPAPRPEGVARLGLSFETADGVVVITRVEPGSAAEQAGLVPGAKVLEVGRRPVKTAQELARVLGAARPGSVVLLRVELDGQRLLRALEVPAPAGAG